MPRQKIKCFIEDKCVAFELVGDTVVGDESILLLQDKNLIENTDWKDLGYTITSFLDVDAFETLKQGIENIIAQLIIRVDGRMDNNFKMINYHKYVNDEQHLKITRLIQHGWNVSEFPIDFKKVEQRISAELHKEVTAEAKHLNPLDFRTGLTEKRYERMYIFNLRIVRPQKLQDNNPPHRDVWIDRLRHAVNIYVPFCGSTLNSSLPLLPGSHLLKESDIERTSANATLNATQYSVPCVTAVLQEPLRLIRPNPNENEMLIFSPYLVHGCAYNFEENQTRISLEARFWQWD